MKPFKIILVLTTVLVVMIQKIAHSQDSLSYKKNEIRVNLLSSILNLPAIDYERLLTTNTSVGLAIGLGIGSEDYFSQFKVLVIPHYRVYFGKEDAAGIFIEGNLAFARIQDNDVVYLNNVPTKKLITNNFGLGAAIGEKYITKNGYIGEIFGGIGRLFGTKRSIAFYPRVGVSLGKRF